jgi:hypothetical protein
MIDLEPRRDCQSAERILRGRSEVNHLMLAKTTMLAKATSRMA